MDVVSKLRLGCTVKLTDMNVVISRVRGEFEEMPGLRLTERQAQKLWALDAAACTTVLHTLVDHCFLTKTTGGAFVRRDANSPRN